MKAREVRLTANELSAVVEAIGADLTGSRKYMEAVAWNDLDSAYNKLLHVNALDADAVSIRATRGEP